MDSSQFATTIEKGGFVVTASIVPPESSDASALKSLAQGLSGKVNAALVTDVEGARMSGLAASPVSGCWPHPGRGKSYVASFPGLQLP